MMSRIIATTLIVLIMLNPLAVYAGSAETSESAYWSNLVHEENSIVASVLYLPYLLLGTPVRIIDGIINPKPASQSTTPPPAHRVTH